MRFDPRHRVVNPVLNRVDELMACWRRITCPVLWVRGTESTAPHWREDTPEQLAGRKACFRDFRELELDRCGHMIHHDAPERLAPALEAFIGRDA
jgi:pimeloyl-ACP methyl ester carboxylesterase